MIWTNLSFNWAWHRSAPYSFLWIVNQFFIIAWTKSITVPGLQCVWIIALQIYLEFIPNVWHIKQFYMVIIYIFTLWIVITTYKTLHFTSNCMNKSLDLALLSTIIIKWWSINHSQNQLTFCFAISQLDRN